MGQNNEIESMLNTLMGIRPTQELKIVFIISRLMGPYILYSDDNDFDFMPETFDVIELNTFLTEKDFASLPTESGAYSAILVIHSFRCNHPQDPTEWDVTFKLKDIKKIKLNYD